MRDSDDAAKWSDLRSALEVRCARLASSGTVDDAIQEALLALVIARATGAMIRDEVGWSVAIVRRRVVNAHRRRRREVARADLDRVAGVDAEVIDWGRSLREVVSRSSTKQAVAKASRAQRQKVGLGPVEPSATQQPLRLSWQRCSQY